MQSWVAELADAGCEAITLGVEPDGDEDDVQELITLCKELDVLGVPMRYRLGLRFDRSVDDWALLGSSTICPRHVSRAAVCCGTDLVVCQQASSAAVLLTVL